MLLLKLGSELPNLVNKFQSVLKIWTKYRLNFDEVECTGDRNFLKKFLFYFTSSGITVACFLFPHYICKHFMVPSILLR